jgi:hypothetical protein
LELALLDIWVNHSTRAAFLHCLIERSIETIDRQWNWMSRVSAKAKRNTTVAMSGFPLA